MRAPGSEAKPGSKPLPASYLLTYHWPKQGTRPNSTSQGSTHLVGEWWGKVVVVRGGCRVKQAQGPDLGKRNKLMQSPTRGNKNVVRKRNEGWMTSVSAMFTMIQSLSSECKKNLGVFR